VLSIHVSARYLSGMGLEIFYDIHAPAGWPADRVRKTLEALREFALEQGFAEVDELVEGEPHTLGLKDPPEDGPSPRAASSEGWHFIVWPGPGCETAWFGLYRYPATVRAEDGTVIPTGWGEGWHYHTWCKTQYADRVSREHFLRCHRGIIAMLDACGDAGLETHARDVSGFWEHRDLAQLNSQIDEWNGIIAAFAGAIKDAAGDSCDGRFRSPIFANADFERLELEGRQTLSKTADKESDDPATR
jgi:hypothetical protein